MIAEGKHSQQLLAKAHQLKEKALATADQTRRNQFLLIATEYKKLAMFYASGDNSMTRDSRQFLGELERPPATVVYLRSYSLDTKSEKRDAVDKANRADAIVYVVLFAALALVAFALVLTPGDQVPAGLQRVFNLRL